MNKDNAVIIVNYYLIKVFDNFITNRDEPIDIKFDVSYQLVSFLILLKDYLIKNYIYIIWVMVIKM